MLKSVDETPSYADKGSWSIHTVRYRAFSIDPARSPGSVWSLLPAIVGGIYIHSYWNILP
jgi:hypothetical protein